MKCKIFTSSLKNNYGGRRYLPYVFTEYGITMLAGILKSDNAVKMSLKIVDTFIAMRKYISTNMLEQRYINNMVLEHNEKINLLEETFNNHIFFEGQIYDAYSLMLDIFNESNNNIIIIDNYIDKTLLDILSKTSKNILIITNKYNNEDYEKYKQQYSNVKFKISNSFHDRFIIIDNKILYHCGASFKDLGKQCFAITRIENENWIRELLERLK